VDSLKALDPNRPIREADKLLQCRECPLCADIVAKIFSASRRATLIQEIDLSRNID